MKPHNHIGMLGMCLDRTPMLASLLTGSRPKVIVDSECIPEDARKEIESAHKVVALVGGGFAEEDGTRRTMEEVVRQARESGKHLIVVDSVTPEVERIKLEVERIKLKEKLMDKVPKAGLASLAWMSGAMGMGMGFPFPERAPREMTKCGLPGCVVMSDKDYCSADHCRKHREMRKAKKS